MAELVHINNLRKGLEFWNKWRGENPKIKPDLSRVNLESSYFTKYDLSFTDLTKTNLSNSILDEVDFREANLSRANLTNSNLSKTNLKKADLKGIKLINANLTNTDLSDADLSYDIKSYYESEASHEESDLSFAIFFNANLKGANLANAIMSYTSLLNADLSDTYLFDAFLNHVNLSNTNLKNANFSGARLFEVIFANVDLSEAKNLDKCFHIGPSTIDFRTYARSGELPLNFLQGCGIPANFIEYLPTILINNPIKYYSCFISYSTKDEEFARRLFTDLQAEGVRCWFAPEDLKPGDRLRLIIDKSIRIYDKLLLVISKNSINSNWVEHEVETALDREVEQNKAVLFPIRLDDSIMEIKEGWAAKLKRERYIGDFRNWINYDLYKSAYNRLLRNLNI